VIAPDGTVIPFAVDAFRRQGLLRGQDEIALTLEHAPAIVEFERRRLAEEPWLTR
jgi:3-isopropylmalate/(R)-2-methylmalate dehydratase small subunit